MVALWVTVWVVVGAVLGYEIWRLDGLAASTVDSGHSLARAGDALGALSSVPLIGDTTGQLGQQVSSTAAGIVSNGLQAYSSIHGISVLMGLSVALIPTLSALAVYVPSRRARRQDMAGIRAALERDGMTPQLEAYLAGRAVMALPAAELLSATDDPQGDLGSGRTGRLAAAELARLGITVSRQD